MKTFHFDLRHDRLQSKTRTTLYLLLGDQRYPITSHDQNSLKSLNNTVLNEVHQANPSAITHFCSVPFEDIPQNQVSMMQIVGSAEDGLNGLPPLYGLIYHVPERSRRRYLTRKLSRNKKRFSSKAQTSTDPIHPKLRAYLGQSSALKSSINTLSLKQQVDLAVAADEFLTPWDTAVGLLFQHPELATDKAYTASVVQDHITGNASGAEDPAQYNRVYELSLKISQQGPATPVGGWATIKQAALDDGTLMYAEVDLVAGDGQAVMTKGQPVMIYDMSDETAAYSEAPVSYATRSVRNDASLQNQSWSQPQGIVADTTQMDSQEAAEVFQARRALRAQSNTGTTFTVSEKTPRHGLEVHTNSLRYQPKENRLSIEVTNWFLRQLGSYVEFYSDTEMKKPIVSPEINGDWPIYFPKWLAEDFETDTQKAIGTVPAINTIMGIPMPTDPTKVDVPWPTEAQAARLMFGGLGTSNWIMPVVWPGVILTGVFNYGVPIFCLAAGAAITNTKFFSEFVSNRDNVIAALAVAFPIVGGGVSTAAALMNTKKVLTTFASTLVGMLAKKGLEKLSAYILARVTAAQATNALPIVGMALRLASIALSVSQMAITTGECLSSPAVLEVDVLRQMELDFTLTPDPKHGEPGRPETAIWPLVAETVEVIVTYKNGTTHVQKQTLPRTTSSEPLVFTFKPIGWGGQFKVSANVYSKNGWLCGKYESDNIAAEPDDPAIGIKTLTGTIEELLVPLTQDTQYLYKQRLGYDSAKNEHIWEEGEVSLKTISDLSCANVGKNLCQAVSLTINQKAYQAGYVYRASGQDIPLEDPNSAPNSGQMYVMQNISVLSDKTLSERLKFSEVGFKTQPALAYDTFGEGPSKDDISPFNFALDSRNGEYHLRHVDLVNGQSGFGFDQTELKSWGQFLIPHIDEMVIHPSGVVIAISYQAGKMQILTLPPEPLPDAEAPQAQVVSGKGVLQGLLDGPVAAKVSIDGSIYILEAINRRIQAFDLKGNPAPSFPGAHLFDMDNAFASDLDAGEFNDAMKALFVSHNVTHLFDFENAELAAQLDGGVLTLNIVNAFSDEGLYLTYNETDDGKIDPVGSSTITVVEAGSRWRLFDVSQNFTYDVVLANGEFSVSDVLDNVVITVVGRSAKWVVSDLAGARSYLLTLTDPQASIKVEEYLAYFPLQGDDNTRYLDLALEAKGYIYVLSYSNPGTGRIPHTAYSVDIYTPTGEFLVRTPDPKMHKDPANMEYIAAARLALDPFRNLFTLDYNTFLGPNERTEPGLSSWIPTTPLFDEAPDTSALFLSQDIPGLIKLFGRHGIIISPDAKVVIRNPDGDYLLQSNEDSYNAILSLNNTGEQRLFVYDILA